MKEGVEIIMIVFYFRKKIATENRYGAQSGNLQFFRQDQTVVHPSSSPCEMGKLCIEGGQVSCKLELTKSPEDIN